MSSEILAQRLGTGTIFKLVGIGLSLSVLPFTVLTSLVSVISGASFGTFNGVELTGFGGFVSSLIWAVIALGICTGVFGCLIAFGLWVFSWIRPIKLSVRGVRPQT